MSKTVSLSQCLELIIESLSNKGEVLFTIRGNSMKPLLQGRRDRVRIVKKDSRKLERYDIPLYVRDDGRYILHRIVEINEDGYTTIGDNQYAKESRVLPSQIVGVVNGFWRNGKYVACHNKYYRAYCRIWYLIYPIRWILFKISRAIVKIRS